MGTADNKANSQRLELMSGVSSECDTSTNEVRITLCDAFMDNYELNLLIHQAVTIVGQLSCRSSLSRLERRDQQDAVSLDVVGVPCCLILVINFSLRHRRILAYLL